MGVCGCRAPPKPSDRTAQTHPPVQPISNDPPATHQLVDVRVAQKKESPDQPDANESDSRLQQRPASKPPPDGNLQVSLRENLGESGQEERSRSPEVGDLDCVIDNQIQYGRKVISRRNKISVWDGLDNSARMIAIKTVELSPADRTERNMGIIQNIVKAIGTLKSKVKHNFLIRYFDCKYVEQDGTLRIISEYYDKSVKNISRNFSYLYDEAFTVQILSDVIVAVDYLHQMDIEAYNLKSSNIFYRGKGDIKLGDYYFSYSLHILYENIDPEFANNDSYFWVSPENLCRKRNGGLANDIWALGCLAFELMTGAPPFYEETKGDVSLLRQKHRERAFPKVNEELLKHEEFIDFLTRTLQYDSYKRPSLQMLMNHPFILKFNPDRIEPSFYDQNLYKQSLPKAQSDVREIGSCPTRLQLSLIDKKARNIDSLFQNDILTNAPSPVKKKIYSSLQIHDKQKLSMKKMLPKSSGAPPRLVQSRLEDPDTLGALQLAGRSNPGLHKEDQNAYHSLPIKIPDSHPGPMLKSEHMSQPEDSLASAKPWGRPGEGIERLEEPKPSQLIERSGNLGNLDFHGTFHGQDIRRSVEESLARRQQNFTFEAQGHRPLIDSDSQPICQSQFHPVSEQLFDEQLDFGQHKSSAKSSQQFLNLSLAQDRAQEREPKTGPQFQHVSIPLIDDNGQTEKVGQGSKKLERVGLAVGSGEKPAKLNVFSSEQEPRPKNSNVEDSTPNDMLVKKRTFEFASLAPQQNKQVSSNNFLRAEQEQKVSNTTDLKVSLSRNTKVSQNPGLSKEMHSRLPFSGAKSVSGGGGPAREPEDCLDAKDDGKQISQIFFSNKTPNVEIMEEKGATEANSPEKAGGFKSKRPRITLNLSASRNQITRKAETHLKESKKADLSFSFKSQSQELPDVGLDASFESGNSDSQR